ncbi:ciliary microtubule associated protein 1B isoform X2 [Zonotrichia leucophrys gambelii]|uniref:ciliary microtubule associated protein 1B isoform X2 n=1 Tax=Zonotrichia leucophrys gambelii TaxID=257770 RepID=UPI00313FFC1D
MPAPLRSPRAAALGAPASPPEPEPEAPPAEPPMRNHGWVGPWRPHRPRGPTSAVYGSPGPKYGVPGGIGKDQRDPSGRRAPAYSFGMRLEGPEEQRSPGPQYLVPAGCTARGPERGPAFTMGGRPRERRASDTPGPAYYSPEQATRVTLPSAPACSVRSRTRPDKPQQTPGPCEGEAPSPPEPCPLPRPCHLPAATRGGPPPGGQDIDPPVHHGRARPQHLRGR